MNGYAKVFLLTENKSREYSESYGAIRFEEEPYDVTTKHTASSPKHQTNANRLAPQVCGDQVYNCTAQNRYTQTWEYQIQAEADHNGDLIHNPNQ